LIYKAVKGAYAQRAFESISVYKNETQSGYELLVLVKDLPIIYSIEFEGNKKVPEEELRQVVGAPKNPEQFLEQQLSGLSGPTVEEKLKLIKSLPLGRPLTPEEIEEMARRIKLKYALEGYPDVEVQYRIEPAKGASKLVFEIKEGAPSYVGEIKIEGLKGVKEGDVKKVMELKEPNYLLFRFKPAYSPQILEDDLKRIEEYLKSEGYLEAKVEDYSVKKEGSRAKITIKVKEGERYKIEEVVVEGNTYFGKNELLGEFLKRLKKEKNYYSKRLIEFLREYILQKYRELGLYATKVLIEEVPDPAKKTVRLIVKVIESPPVYNRWTEIRGNYETRDYVIRREVEVHEGDLLTEDRVKWSKIWLNRLGYFAGVRIEPRLLTPDTAVTDVEVKERFTGQFSVGIGYGETSGLSGFVSLRKGNFLGTGDIVSISASWGEFAQNYSFSYTRKWFMKKPQDLTFSAYSTYHDYDAYNIDRKGISTTLSRRFWRYWRWSVGADFQSIDYSDISPDASIYVKQMAQFNSATILRTGIERDTRDNYIFPTEGSLFSAFNKLGGFLGGDEKFEKMTLQAAVYRSDPYFMKGTIFSARVKTGFITPWGGADVVPIDERFFVGGAYTIRGYKYGYVGPLDPNTGDPIGAKRMLVVNLEANYPIKKDVFYVAGFFDAGNGADTWGGLFKDLKAGAGFGVRFITPMAPIKVDFAWKLKKVPGDSDNFRIHLTIGSFF